jgi:hypothetical protein
MSKFNTAEATCPDCGETIELQLVASVNADARPDLRDAILSGEFQAELCPKCGKRLRLGPHFSYLDVGRGQWILVQPLDLIEAWPAEEADARAIYDRSFGAAAPESARLLADDMQARLVFGWPALREKLVGRELSIDDTALELLKIAIIRNTPNSPFADQTELRLAGAGDGTLRLVWLESATERMLSGLEVPRDVYDDVAGDQTSWAPIRAQLDGQLFVDMKRLLIA